MFFPGYVPIGTVGSFCYIRFQREVSCRQCIEQFMSRVRTRVCEVGVVYTSCQLCSRGEIQTFINRLLCTRVYKTIVINKEGKIHPIVPIIIYPVGITVFGADIHQPIEAGRSCIIDSDRKVQQVGIDTSIDKSVVRRIDHRNVPGRYRDRTTTGSLTKLFVVTFTDLATFELLVERNSTRYIPSPPDGT